MPKNTPQPLAGIELPPLVEKSTGSDSQTTIDPMYRNLAKGKTLEDKLEIMGRNAHDIDTLCDLMAGFDTSITDEPLTHANAIIQRLAREIILNYAGAVDINMPYKASGSLSGD